MNDARRTTEPDRSSTATLGFDAVLSEIRDEVVAARIKGESTAARTDELLAEIADARDQVRAFGEVLRDLLRQVQGPADRHHRTTPSTSSTLLAASILLLSWAVALGFGERLSWAVAVLAIANLSACIAVLLARRHDAVQR